MKHKKNEEGEVIGFEIPFSYGVIQIHKLDKIPKNQMSVQFLAMSYDPKLKDYWFLTWAGLGLYCSPLAPPETPEADLAEKVRAIAKRIIKHCKNVVGVLDVDGGGKYWKPEGEPEGMDV